jgi:hypothetical protein
VWLNEHAPPAKIACARSHPPDPDTVTIHIIGKLNANLEVYHSREPTIAVRCENAAAKENKMNAVVRTVSLIATLVGMMLVANAGTAFGQYQQRRYQPSRPTTSPYLNLFRFNNSVLPNYQSLVQPEQEAQRFRLEQSRLNRQQQTELTQIQQNVRVLKQSPVSTKLVAPTGQGSWFNVPGGSQFGDTREYFSKAGGGSGVGGGGGSGR